MSLPVISLIALLFAIVISCVTTLNIGTLSLGLSLLVSYIGGVKISEVIKGYPTNIFLMLAGSTYLFALAQVNGTLEKIVKYTIKGVRGNTALLPFIFFFLAFILSSMGPGPTVIAALMAPMAMLLAEEVGISPLMMSIVAGNGGQAGSMSPIAIGGIITTGITAKMGLTNIGWKLWLNMLITYFIISLIAYILFGGLRLFKKGDGGQRETLARIQVEPFDHNQLITLLGIIIFVVGALAFKMDVGLGAFLIGSILSFFKVADEGKAIKQMPWGAILFVCGVTVLINLMGQIGGMDLFASLIARFSTPFTITLVAGFIAGLISAYASTTGVILPAFIPMAPMLLEKVGAPPSELLALISAIAVCGFMTDMSPLSTTGALYYANAGPKTDKQKLFRDMLIWGLSMSVVGAIVSWIYFSVFHLA
ncbi:SLC13 family permease [Neomoorella humiferrea]|uniref:Dicarboxylate carrier MatC N-terminal domain-containing protein n=1 Tax=Neomoorella humiferrea TaxID=676965 RepID=A0A2T0AYH0_9FIRM|nr:SLC13 family permease [Moorella humiferrea]PRR75795.1 hypothetical protein MOHU_01760 [Moorella humiferrea]